MLNSCLSACSDMSRIAACLKLAEIFQSASKLRIIHLMLSNLSLKCTSSPESDHGVCNLNTLEVQVKKEDLKMSYFLLPGCHAVT